MANSSSSGVESSPYSMTTEILQKRLYRENKGRLSTQACVALLASVAALSFGTVMGWACPTVRIFIYLGNQSSVYNVTETELVWVSSLMPLGCSVGTTVWTYSANKMGPKHTMVVQTPFYIFSFLLTVTVQWRVIFLVGRFFSGFMSVAFIVGGECLLVDCVHPGYLRNMLVFFNSSVSLGILLSYIVGHYLSRWWLAMMITAIPTLNAICLLFLPESPVYLYEKNQRKAELSLSWYRGQENIYTELRSIKKDSELRKTTAQANNYMFYSKVVLRAILIVFGLTTFQAFSGYYAFIFFNVGIPCEHSKSMLGGPIESITFGIILYVCKFISNIIHKSVPFGIRTPLLISCSLISITFTILTGFVLLKTFVFESFSSISWMPLFILSMFVIGYEAGLGIYAEVLLVHYLPYEVYPRAKTLIRACYWLEIFLLTRFVIVITNASANYITFVALTLLSYLSIIYCAIFIIETRDKTLLQIQLEIGGNPIGHRGTYNNRHYFGGSPTAIIM